MAALNPEEAATMDDEQLWNSVVARAAANKVTLEDVLGVGPKGFEELARACFDVKDTKFNELIISVLKDMQS
jgi:hypothetical protein